MRRFLLLLLCFTFFSTGCVSMLGSLGGGKPKGTSDNPNYAMGPDIRNAWSRDVRKFPAYKTGSTRIIGILNSVGSYYDGVECMANLRGASWQYTTFDDFGRGGKSVAWFLADVMPDGSVIYAKAFITGGASNADVTVDMTRPVNGSYGQISGNEWKITVMGYAVVETRGFEEENPMFLTVYGKGNPLTGPKKFTGQYVLNGFEYSPNLKNPKHNADYGSASLIRVTNDY